MSSALYVAESSGKESEVQGVQILMKDDEKGPMTSAQQFSPSYSIDDVIREPESAVATSAEQVPVVATSAEEVSAVATTADANQPSVVKQEMAKPDDNFPTTTSTSTTTATTATTTAATTTTTATTMTSTATTHLLGSGLAKPDPDNSGLIGHIQKLLELNASLMETVQAQLTAQANILKSIIEGSVSSRQDAQ